MKSINSLHFGIIVLIFLAGSANISKISTFIPFIASSSIATGPDLVIVKSNNGSPISLGSSFEWQLVTSNIGDVGAIFTDGQTILSDQLPSSNFIAYNSVTVDNMVGITGSGTIICTIDSNQLLTCAPSGGHVTIGATTGTFRTTIDVTPYLDTTFVNPTGGTCMVDPNSTIIESDEGNNSANNDTVRIVKAPKMSVERIFNMPIPNSGTDDVGNVNVGTDTLEYTIDNSEGSDTLFIGAITISSKVNVNAVSVVPNNSDTILSSSSGFMAIAYSVILEEAFSFNVSIANNDLVKNPYLFTISGTGGDAVPVVTVAIVAPNIRNEDDAASPDLIFQFTRTGSTVLGLTINFSIDAASTATFGTDYTLSGHDAFTNPTGTITFPATESTVDLHVNFTADNDVEPDETIIVNIDLSSP